jgi:predicted PurR-regulated permease PerM
LGLLEILLVTASWVNFLKNYLKGQLLLSCILALLYGAAFYYAQLPWGFSLGLLTGFFSWVPFFGSLVGFFVALVVISFHFTWPLLIKVLAFYFLIQLLEAFFLAPKILGKTMGLSFWASLGAVLIGAVVAGPIGAMVAIPVAALLKFYLKQQALKEVKENEK